MGVYFQDWLNDPTGETWEYTSNDAYMQMIMCVQECLMWRGECSYNVELGIDYERILNSTVFLRTQLEEILEKYRQFFREIIVNIEYPARSKVIVMLDFWFYVDINQAMNSNFTKTGNSEVYNKQVRLQLDTESRVMTLIKNERSINGAIGE